MERMPMYFSVGMFCLCLITFEAQAGVANTEACPSVNTVRHQTQRFYAPSRINPRGWVESSFEPAQAPNDLGEITSFIGATFQPLYGEEGDVGQLQRCSYRTSHGYTVHLVYRHLNHRLQASSMRLADKAAWVKMFGYLKTVVYECQAKDPARCTFIFLR